MAHRLDPLLRPRSVAVIGASARADSMGWWALENLRRGGYPGAVFPVNPKHAELGGRRCYARVTELPELPDLAIFAIGDRNVEAALDDVIRAGIPAAVIMSSLAIDGDRAPKLAVRVGAKIAEAGLIVCGANGMGFYNVRDRVWACGFDSAHHEPPGRVAIISHSGAGMSGIIDCEERLDVNFAVSTGNELSVTMDEYLDFVLELPETRVVGLFVETSRRPQALRLSLAKAAARNVPIVALKVGRTEASARLAESHSGAMAGEDAAYEALFDRYGVQRVTDQEEWTTALIMFSQLHPVGPGGLVTLHDSGGERQLMIDLAADVGVPLTELAPATVAELRAALPAELPAVNPLDAWSRGGPDAGDAMTRCLSLMMQDDGAAAGAVVHDRAPGGRIYRSYLDYMHRARGMSGKPVALVSARQGSGHDPGAVSSTRAGYPVLDGVRPFLVGMRALFDYRDFRQRSGELPPIADPSMVKRWSARLASGERPGEAGTLELLDDFGVEAVRPVPAESADEVADAARRIGYPVVLKTAAPGLSHKSDHGGVVVGIPDAETLSARYSELSGRLGRSVLVAPMVEAGVEILFGIKRDRQFGPVVLLGFGGVFAEILDDVAFALPPFDVAHAERCFNRLKLRPLLDGVRGLPAVDMAALAESAARFSLLAHELGDFIEELDVNPLIARGSSIIAVDALITVRQGDVKG